MKYFYPIIAFILSVFLFVQCRSDEKSELGKVKIDGVEMKIHFAKLVSQDTENTGSSNIRSFHFFVKDGGVEREIRLVLSYPYNYSGIDGEYNILGTTRQMSIADSFYFVKDGNSTKLYSNLTIGECTVTHLGDDNYKVNFSIQPQNAPLIQGNFNGKMILE